MEFTENERIVLQSIIDKEIIFKKYQNIMKQFNKQFDFIINCYPYKYRELFKEYLNIDYNEIIEKYNEIMCKMNEEILKTFQLTYENNSDKDKLMEKQKIMVEKLKEYIINEILFSGICILDPTQDNCPKYIINHCKYYMRKGDDAFYNTSESVFEIDNIATPTALIHICDDYDLKYSCVYNYDKEFVVFKVMMEYY